METEVLKQLNNLVIKYGATAFNIANSALRVQSLVPGLAMEPAIELAKRLDAPMFRNDEPRFTIEDYIDAVCLSDTFMDNKDKSLSENILYLLSQEDDDFDQIVIATALHMRQKYDWFG